MEPALSFRRIQEAYTLFTFRVELGSLSSGVSGDSEHSLSLAAKSLGCWEAFNDALSISFPFLFTLHEVKHQYCI